MSEENAEPTLESSQPEDVQQEVIEVEEMAPEQDAINLDVTEEASPAAPAPQTKVLREPLSPQTRWTIFGVAIAVCVVIGVAAPLSWALTDEQSSLNPNHASLVTTTEKSSSSASASSTSGASASSGSTSSSTAASGNPSNGDYFLPDSATKRYTADELAGLSDYELYLARNEAYAKYGRKFKNADLTEYFSGKSWYVPKYEPADFDAMPTPLNDTERANVDLIRQLEAQRNSPYAV